MSTADAKQQTLVQQALLVQGEIGIARLNAMLAKGWRVTHIASMGGVPGVVVVYEQHMNNDAKEKLVERTRRREEALEEKAAESTDRA